MHDHVFIYCSIILYTYISITDRPCYLNMMNMIDTANINVDINGLIRNKVL